MADLGEISSITAPPHRFKSAAWHPVNKRPKQLKQLVMDEQKRLAAATLPPDPVTYFLVEAPPLLRAPKTYCDVTGLPTPYKAPGNNLRFYNAEVYDVVRGMAPGVDQQYLELRGANVVLR